MGNPIDMTGKRYGRLVAVRPMPNRRKWWCRCDCGAERAFDGYHVRSGASNSCGCLMREINGARGTHRMAGTPTFTAWCTMRQRCSNPATPCFPLYGGRGIKVCDRWQYFENFLADMGLRPSGMSIERINNDGNYEPGNCRWASARDQANNRRSNKRLTHKGRTQTIAEWAREVGISNLALAQRLRHGWTVAEAIERPLRSWPKRKFVKGELRADSQRKENAS